MQSRRAKVSLHSIKIGLLGLAALVAAPAALALGTTEPEAAPHMAAQLAAAHLPEPLVRTAPTTRSEDRALLHALAAYEKRAQPDDFHSLIAFLQAHPRSGWRVSLWTDLGLSYRHYGYFSRALDALGAAWSEGKDAKGLRIRAEVDRAVGELALLHAELGHAEQVSVLLQDIGNRPISGPATATVQIARETLWTMQNDPQHMWLCGPLALRFLMLSDKVPPKKLDFLQWYRASPKGVSLAELERLSDKAGQPYVAVYRGADQPVPVPSVVHWKVGHYAAILAKENGGYRVYDPVLGIQDHWISAGALKAEASGYFLVRADQANSAGWRKVASGEAGQIWGAGPTNGPPPDFPSGPPADPPPDVGNGGGPSSSDGGGGPDDSGCMTRANIGELAVGIVLSDTPCGYVPPKGPSARVTITYNQWEASQPAVFSFFNISPKWTFNFLTYIQDDPSGPGNDVTRYRPTGGDSPESGYDVTTGTFTADELDGSVLVMTSQSPVIYTRYLRDGTVETYAQSDGSIYFPRHVFLSKITDPQGNTLTLNYQTVSNQVLLTSLIDATGRQTTFTYDNASFPLAVTQITDPFGRSATLNYDSQGRLISITDVLGLTSSYTYDANSLVNSLTTPYGTTTFNYGGSGNARWAQVTDPLGNNEREETVQPAPVAFSDPSNTVPQGIVNPFNQYLDYRDSFHWDNYAYVAAGCTLTGNLPSTCNYNDARDTHFTHDPNNISITWEATESRKYPLENRIWQNLPGQDSNPACTIGTACAGTYDQPSAVGRVLDDGSTQLSQYSYNAAGNLTQIVDPAGRTTNFIYAPNNIDLVEADQVTGDGSVPTASYTYNQQHRPVTYTDAAYQETDYSYNSAGQVTRIALPLGRVWSFSYDSLGRLTSVVNPNGVTAVSYTYDAYDRIATATDSEGYTLGYSYDAADRLTQVAFPDGTTRTYTYQNLDLVSATDREGHTTTYGYDADRRLISILNPASGLTKFAYFPNGRLQSLTDPDGNITTWTIDVEGRVTQKQYANGAQQNFTYENTTSRLASVTDALGQTKQFSYTVDNRLAEITYANAKEPTPYVYFSYDPYFPRLNSTYGEASGATEYSYVPVGSPGALRLRQEAVTLPEAVISYQYDDAGRLTSRSIGSTQETFGYDNLDRLISHTDPLGTFDISYLGQTNQPTGRQLAGTSDQVTWSYLPNSGDRRLASINNYAIRQYQFTTTPEALISAITQQSSSGSQTWNFTYDAGNRLTDATSSANLKFRFGLDDAGNILSVQQAGDTTIWRYNNVNELVSSLAHGLPVTYTYDLDGNRLSEGAARHYAWDAENRLASITIAGGGTSQFSYDALGRRIAIRTNTGTTQFLWCGSHICQSGGANGGVQRLYYAEGEFIPSTGTKLYYGRDQLGSVRDVAVVTAHGTTTQAYDYDPYGNALAVAASGIMPDFRYAGMYYDAGSGLYLTKRRAYDPATGRWLSRDPMGEMVERGPQSVSPEMPDLPIATLPPLPSVDTFAPIHITLPGQAAIRSTVPDLVRPGPAFANRSNLYLYVSADPVNLVDPFGLQQGCWQSYANGQGPWQSNGGQNVDDAYNNWQQNAPWNQSNQSQSSNGPGTDWSNPSNPNNWGWSDDGSWNDVPMGSGDPGWLNPGATDSNLFDGAPNTGPNTSGDSGF